MTDAPNGWPPEARKAVKRAIAGAGLRIIVSGRYVSRADAALAALAPYHAAALAAQAMAMREAAAKECEIEAGTECRTDAASSYGAAVAKACAIGIRALPLPSTSALDAALAEAKREGMREAAAIVLRHTYGCFTKEQIAAAILAAAKEVKA
jgi:hypothetical protein